MSGSKRALFWRKSRNPLIILAVSIYAIMLFAYRPADSWGTKRKGGNGTGYLLNRLVKADLYHLQAELSNVRVALRQNVSIHQPSPRDKHCAVVFSELGFKYFRFLEVSLVALHMSVGADLKLGIVAFLPNEPIFAGFSAQWSGKKIENSWSSWRIARILPNGPEFPDVRSNWNDFVDFTNFDLIKYHVGTLYRIQGFGTYLVRTIGGFSSSFHLPPLEPGIVSVINDGGQCKGVDDDRRPVFPEVLPELLQAVGFLFFIAGFGLIYTVGCIKEESIFNLCQILCSVLLIVIGWASEQAALNLMDLGRIDWRQLFF
jgi:hypothetical protein